jgi:hypothetical protein
MRRDDVWLAPEDVDPWVQPPPSPPPPRRARRGGRGLVLLAIGLVLAFVTSLAAGPQITLPGWESPWDGTFDEQDSGLAEAAWSCEPIGYRVVLEGAPAGAEPFVDDAVERLSDASSGTITFRREESLTSWAQDDPRYRGITIGWAPDSVADWQDDTVGVGGGSVVLGERIVDGDAWLRPDIDELTYEPSFSSAGPVLLHELGHAVGLDHEPQGSNSLMTPRAGSVLGFTARDAAALQSKGEQACSR